MGTDFAANTDISELTDRALATVQQALEQFGTQLPSDSILYRYKNDILLVRSVGHFSPILTRLYAIRFGLRIGRIEGNIFEPQAPLGVHFVHKNLQKIELTPEMLQDFLRGLPVHIEGSANSELVQVFWNHSPLGFGHLHHGILKSQLPKYMFWK
jgi:NOL1/NOP2/fmu family ribosome biogenesis protein